MARTSKTATRVVKGAERRRRILQLRIAGLSQEEIAAREGITRQGVNKHLHVALNDIREDITEQADELRAIESARLDTLISSIWELAIGEPLRDQNGRVIRDENNKPIGHKRPDLKAHSQLSKYIAQRCRLLVLNLESRGINLTLNSDGDTDIDTSKLSTEELATLSALLDKAGS